MRQMTIRTAVVGSGCAGWNAIDTLLSLGQADCALITEHVNWGTSRNTGSDKQTYYKLSLSGDDGDSVGDLARTLCASDVNGDTALCEAASSARCFLKLASLGVPFPVNEFGEYAGYRTDHDERRRASSAGPLTSRYMTEALERSARGRGAAVYDHMLAFRILTDKNGVTGLLCLDTGKNEWVQVNCAHVILCTGGPAMLYKNSVYPESQRGMSGMAFEAGASGANLDFWQYGIASVKFRWNLSGSYQQSVPRYVSVDENGVEREFLADALGQKEAIDLTFLKGYQWPFDPDKVNGSSRVDLLVKAEEDKGRRVYLDYTKNPRGYDASALSDEARDYLANCSALGDTPIFRLRAMNEPAIELYRSHGIDIEKEYLEISVCAQHHNGGIAVDAHWMSAVPGLYVCGEAAGTFGCRRPGGTALNSTQVGSLRAAEHIAYESTRDAAQCPQAELPLLPDGDPQAIIAELQAEMSRCAAFDRDEDSIGKLISKAERLLTQTVPARLDDPDLVERIRLRDMLLTMREVLSAMRERPFHADEPGVMLTKNGVSALVPARPLPQRELWFEKVWKEYKLRTENR